MPGPDLIERPRAQEMLARLYAELRSLAVRTMHRERPGHTLGPTGLVHEAVLRLSAQDLSADLSHSRLLALASLMMRRILVDHARARAARLRNELTAYSADLPGEISPEQIIGVIEFDRALSRLESAEPRLAQVVQLRFFGGLSMDEIAAELGVSPRTVAKDWAVARAWLRRELER